MRTSLFAGVFLAVAGLHSAAAAVPPLFEDGKTSWVVVIAPNAPPAVRYAAEEFTNVLKRVSGADFAIAESAADVKHAIRIQSNDSAWAKEKVSYALEGNDLVISGNQPRAALHATYAFLDRALGCRWYWPGEDGAFLPTLSRWTFPSGFGFSYEPKIWFRGFHHCGDWRDRNNFLVWESRNYVNIHRHGNWKGEEKYGHYSMPSMHNANLNGEKELFAAHPECFAELAGHRSMVNICFSSDLGAEKVAARIAADISRRIKSAPMDIISIFPNDNQDYCQCASCKEKGVSTGWFSYFSKVVNHLKTKFPGLRFSTIAYQGYLDPPDCTIADTAFVEYASHPRCHIHRWDDPNCAANVSEMKRFTAWTKRGDVPIGHYAYEYDAISGHAIFMPFFSMVGDAVEKAAEMNLVTQIPEVGLSPKTGPDVKAHAVQNRLTILYYARKMWEPTLKLEDFLDDLTTRVYGKAAKEMKEYFLLMDKAWESQPGRIGLFADGMNVSANLLADDKVRARTSELLASAEKLVQGDERAMRNVNREKVLYAQIADYREQRVGNARAFNLPLVKKGEKPPKGGMPKLALEIAKNKTGACTVSGYWSPKEELVIGFAGTKDAELRIVDDNSERYTFSVKGGVRTARRISDVGVEMTTWQPAWTAERKGTGILFRIPLAAFGRLPGANDAWEMRFAADGAAYPLRDDMTMKAVFLAAPAADRPVVFFTNERRCMNNLAGLRAQAEADGWKLLTATNFTELVASAPQAATFMFQVPSSKDFPAETAALLREKVANGGTLLARSWASIRLDVFLSDPALKSACERPKEFPLSERKAKYIREGDWCRKPWNFEGTLRNWFAPCYMQVGYGPEWVDYASMPSHADPSRMIPFVTARKYGKGCIILVGETLHVSHFRLIDNIRRDLGLE